MSDLALPEYPVNLACRNGAHDRCSGRSTFDADPIAECPCGCHYSEWIPF